LALKNNNLLFFLPIGITLLISIPLKGKTNELNVYQVACYNKYD